MDFRLYTGGRWSNRTGRGVLKAWDDPKTGDRFVSGTTSSTIRDLQGDEMTLAALQEIRAKALDNMTMFLNRGYRFPNSGRKALP